MFTIDSPFARATVRLQAILVAGIAVEFARVFDHLAAAAPLREAGLCDNLSFRHRVTPFDFN
jgi:hypothetical protein